MKIAVISGTNHESKTIWETLGSGNTIFILFVEFSIIHNMTCALIEPMMRNVDEMQKK